MGRVKTFHLVDDVVCLNVGGSVYKISKETLKSIPNTFFYDMFNEEVSAIKSPDGCYYIDRSPYVIDRILDYKREKSLNVFDVSNRHKMQVIYDDSIFYKIPPIIQYCQRFNYQMLDIQGRSFIYQIRILFTNNSKYIVI